jgi:hypothetical protein
MTFSIINHILSLDDSHRLERREQALLFCKVNIELMCLEFYGKKNLAFLNKIVRSEEYSFQKINNVSVLQNNFK